MNISPLTIREMSMTNIKKKKIQKLINLPLFRVRKFLLIENVESSLRVDKELRDKNKCHHQTLGLRSSNNIASIWLFVHLTLERSLFRSYSDIKMENQRD